METTTLFDSQLMAFAVVAAVVTIIPGADMALMAHSVLTRGRRAGYVTSVGVCTGLWVHAIASALGLSAILMTSATLFSAVKLAGALYLVALGVLSVRRALIPDAGALVVASTATSRDARRAGDDSPSDVEMMIASRSGVQGVALLERDVHRVRVKASALRQVAKDGGNVAFGLDHWSFSRLADGLLELRLLGRGTSGYRDDEDDCCCEGKPCPHSLTIGHSDGRTEISALIAASLRPGVEAKRSSTRWLKRRPG